MGSGQAPLEPARCPRYVVTLTSASDFLAPAAPCSTDHTREQNQAQTRNPLPQRPRLQVHRQHRPAALCQQPSQEN